MRRIFQDTAVRKGAFSEADLAIYRQALAQPKALTSAINYYRNLINPRQIQRWFTEPLRQITIPTMVIWSDEDFALSQALCEGMETLFSQCLRLEMLRECGHWSQQEAPQTVNRLLLDFLKP